MAIPYIPETRNYWLVRTKGGRFYDEFRRRGEIGLNWNEITPRDINNRSEIDIKRLISKHYPESRNKSRIANQLRIFEKQIKENDIVVITGPASHKFSIGRVLSNESAEISRDLDLAEEDRKYCPYTKRKKVQWLKELKKWDVELPMFKLLQHAQHTISDANKYRDNIESMIHDFYLRENYAQINIRVKREGSIPPKEFFTVGNDLLLLVEQFSSYTDYKYDTEITSTEININSPGKMKFAGKVLGVTVLGLILVSLTGGQFDVNLPDIVGGSISIEMNSLIGEVDDFLDSRSDRKQSEVILNKYIHELDIESPEELKQLLDKESKESE
ncbi:hypothetical protein J5S49_13610 [Virgibacillus halodenitrificans]|uniref:hypothetical protein n=1 Tax=Virgibacillus halodenitrificans TaxID=1482 RepID=UPI001F2C9824|nr:hypothetical protein [Virgibacillus halodenitrificans]MCG1029329.1 hypothetical protein [Virgibacillus halodenitrificans]